MATELVGKNRKSISMYCTALRITGWLLIVGLVILHIWRFSVHRLSSQSVLYLSLPQFVVGGLFYGVFTLGLAQLVRYIFENDYQPGWLLRHACEIMCVYVVLLLASSILHHVYILRVGAKVDWSFLLSTIVLLVLRLLIIIGVAGILRRVMPIIAESKTLV